MPPFAKLKYYLGPNACIIVPIGNEIVNADRKSKFIAVLLCACSWFCEHHHVLPNFVKPSGERLFETITCFVMYIILVYHAIGYFFAGRCECEQPRLLPVAPQHGFLDHCWLYLKRWWKMTKFLYCHYARLCARFLFRLSVTTARNGIRKYMGYRAAWGEADYLLVRDLNVDLYQRLEMFNEREMLPLDRNRGVYLRFEDFRFPDFARFPNWGEVHPQDMHDIAINEAAISEDDHVEDDDPVEEQQQDEGQQQAGR